MAPLSGLQQQQQHGHPNVETAVISDGGGEKYPPLAVGGGVGGSERFFANEAPIAIMRARGKGARKFHSLFPPRTILGT